MIEFVKGLRKIDQIDKITDRLGKIDEISKIITFIRNPDLPARQIDVLLFLGGVDEFVA